MCKNLQKIRNPYYLNSSFQYDCGSIKPLSNRFVSQREYIDVPCGSCGECRNIKYFSILQRVQMESLTSYVYFCTLTYDDEHIPHMDFVDDRNNFQSLYYSDISHIQNMMKRLRNTDMFQDRGIRYYAATEYGSRRFRPHHHMLLFVAKKSTDSDSTPLEIERYLYDRVKLYYSVNVGTRKNPRYDPLFTYAERVNKYTGKKESNYTLTLVRDKELAVTDSKDSINTLDSILSTANYILGYINKESQFDNIFDSYIQSNLKLLPLDLQRIIKRVFKSRQYYSKHLGFGFYEDGSKVVPSIQSKSLTQRAVFIKQTLDMLPPLEEDFRSLYPSLYDDMCRLCDHVLSDEFSARHFDNTPLATWLEGLCDHDLLMFNILNYYWPDAVSALIHRCHMSNKNFSPNLLPLRYDSKYRTSKTYRYIRSYIESGFTSKMTFLSFKFGTGISSRFVPLCSYFKRYCSTFADVERLYDIIGVSDFDSYVDLMKQYQRLNDNYLLKQSLNEYRCEFNRPDYDDQFSPRNLLKSKIDSIFVPRFSSIFVH